MFQSFNLVDKPGSANLISSDSNNTFEKYKTLLEQLDNLNNLEVNYDNYLTLLTKTLVELDNSDYLVSKLIVANIISAYNVYERTSVIQFTNFINQFLGDKIILGILFTISELQPLLLEPTEYNINLVDETIIINDNTFVKLFKNILNYHCKQLELKIHNLKSVPISNYLQQNCLTLSEFNTQTRQLIDELMSPELYALMKMLVFMANKEQLSPTSIQCCGSLAVPLTFPIYDRKLELLESIIVVVNTLQNHFNTSTIKYHSLFNLTNFSKELYYLTFSSIGYTKTNIVKLEDRTNEIDWNNITITTYDDIVKPKSDDVTETEIVKTKDNSDSIIELYSTMFKSDTQCYQLIPGLEITYNINYPVSETVLVSFLESSLLFSDVIDYKLTDRQIYETLANLLNEGYETLYDNYSLNVYTYNTLVDYLMLRSILTFDDSNGYISRRILRYYLLVHSYNIKVLNDKHYKLYNSINYLTLSDNINGKPSIPYIISKDIIQNSKFNIGFTLTTSDKTNVNYTILNQDYKNNRVLSSLIFSQSKNNDELFGI